VLSPGSEDAFTDSLASSVQTSWPIITSKPTTVSHTGTELIHLLLKYLTQKHSPSEKNPDSASICGVALVKCQLLKVCTRSLIDRMLGVTGCSHGNIIRRSFLCCSVSSLLATSAADDCCGNEHSFQQHRSIFAHFSNEVERKTGFGRSRTKHQIIRDFHQFGGQFHFASCEQRHVRETFTPYIRVNMVNLL